MLCRSLDRGFFGFVAGWSKSGAGGANDCGRSATIVSLAALLFPLASSAFLTPLGPPLGTRRHLTPGQKAGVAARAEPLFAAQAKQGVQMLNTLSICPSWRQVAEGVGHRRGRRPGR